MTPQVILPLSENDIPKTIKILKMTPQQNGRPPLTGNKQPAPKVETGIHVLVIFH